MDIQKLEQLIQVVNGAEVSEVSITSEDGTLRIRKGQGKPAHQTKVRTEGAKKQGTKPAQASPASPAEKLVVAPMVGIFHSFNGSVAVGNQIAAGQVVGSIESMKLMNDVTADAGGTIVEVLVEDGMPVEYGQALLKLSE